MSRSVEVRLGERSYRVEIGGGYLDQTGELLESALGGSARQVAIISNRRVFDLYGTKVARSLKRSGYRVCSHLIGDGERYKSLKTAEAVYTFLINERIERKDVVLALGGGVVGDLAGFVAATYLRGIRFAQIPTTLLAQIDSSVGGKTAVNHPLGKNLIGAFYQPNLVIIDPSTLRTMPAREMTAGLCESVKYGVIRDEDLFERLCHSMPSIKQIDEEILTEIIARCCRIKAEVVEQDEREGGLRRILNFGHTVGHALEAVTRYRRFKHGEAVGYGMIAAGHIAAAMGLLSDSELSRLKTAVALCGKLPIASDLDSELILEAMQHDKKSDRGKLHLILPQKIGAVAVYSDVPRPVIRLALRKALV